MSSNVFDICSSDDEELPNSSGLKISHKSNVINNGTSNHGGKRQLDESYYGKNQIGFVSPAPSMSSKKAKTKPSPPTKVYSLIWVCSHGKGRSRSWTKKALKIMGVYGTKDAAEQAKCEIMNEYDCCGHGDILAGDTWADEIDLVIRESPLQL